jgi:DNA polymerase-3 subunit gamma/tau
MIEHMAFICQKEDFKIPQESLVLMGREATGSMRDALSLLDQVLSCFKGSVSHEQVLDILGVIDRKYVFDLCSTILQGDIAVILDALDNCYHRGHDLIFAAPSCRGILRSSWMLWIIVTIADMT